MIETDILLRTILYQILNAKSLEEAQKAIEVMCTKDQIAAVKEMIDDKRS